MSLLTKTKKRTKHILYIKNRMNILHTVDPLSALCASKVNALHVEGFTQICVWNWLSGWQEGCIRHAGIGGGAPDPRNPSPPSPWSHIPERAKPMGDIPPSLFRRLNISLVLFYFVLFLSSFLFYLYLFPFYFYLYLYIFKFSR